MRPNSSDSPLRSRASTKNLEFWALGLILLAAFLLRLIGLRFGFPLLTHPDETYILDPVLRMSANATLDPGQYNRPDLITIYINLAVLNLVSLLSYGKSLAAAFNQHILTFYFLARLVTAVMGTALPLVGYWLGKEAKGSFAIPAAALLAFFPAFVAYSHYATPDVPITLFTLLVIFFAARFLNTRQPVWLALAVVMAAVNTAEKYPGLLSLGIVYVAVIWQVIQPSGRSTRQAISVILRQLLLWTGVYVWALYLVAPVLFAQFGTVITAALAENQSSHLGADGLGWLGNMQYYLGAFFGQAGPLVVLFAAIGAYRLFKEREGVLLLGLYGAGYWIALSVLTLHWERWALPMETAPLILASAGFSYVLARIRGVWLHRGAAAVGLAVVFSLFMPALANSITFSYTDTRVAALDYCGQNGITAENSIYEHYTPFSPKMSGNFRFDYPYDISRDYIILSSAMFGRYQNEPERYAEQVAVYQQIRQKNALVASFDPFPSPVTPGQQFDALRYFILWLARQPVEPRYSGPQILIYRVLPTP